MTDELKPVAWHTEDHRHDKSSTTYDKDIAERWRGKEWPVTPMFYAIPPTHRVVSVAQLERLLEVIAWPDHPAAIQLRAIIDNPAEEYQK